ncbi:MAG: hypothetical protein NC307_01400 [Roseburia sp.]|nr:hypothetical protein [Roseburia sp.]
MNMTSNEIVRQYKEGKNQREQIKILADMNLCEKEEIEKILLDNGCRIPGQNPKKKIQNESAEPEENIPAKEPQEKNPHAPGTKETGFQVPDKVKELVNAKMVRLQEAIDAYQKKIKEYETEMEELSGFLKNCQ